MIKYTIFPFLLACFASIAIAQFDHSKFNDSSPLSMLFQPDEQLGDLFPAVQLYPVFNGSGIFVRCSPLSPPEEIVAAYEAVKNQSDFNLTAFVYQNFELPPNPPNVTTNTSVDVIEHIELLWPILTRQPEPQTILSSLIPLPNPYIVPGGHFQEVYYWDSFFTMLGLQKSGLTTLIRDIIDNFAFLINLLGHIPNGNRGYYMSRSQPPFFAMMLEILAQERGGQIWYTYGPVLRKEYDFWMDGADNLTETNNTYRRTVRMPDGTILNRYWDDKDTPRPEGYLDDVLLSRNTTRDPADLFRNIRAACESGWDFSSRWFIDPMNMTTIRTTHLIPVDLNSLMYHIELTLARVAKMEQDQETAKLFTQKANTRLAALNKYCWSEQDNFFYDYDFVLNQTTNIPTLAASYPLYFNMSTKSQAAGVASRLQSEFSDIGGLLTTLTNSTQQWDAPNGWAPLQWMSIQGLKNYGYTEFANNITTSWAALNIGVYNKTGKLVEKYNVETIDLEGGGGQYPTQDGFGWTNGVLLALLSEEGYTIERIDA